MDEQHLDAQPRDGERPAPRPADDGSGRPWRTEGLPADAGGGGGPGRQGEWVRRAAWFAAGFLLLFGIVSAQDSYNRLEVVPYTEFTAQVQAGNVATVFSRLDTIEGSLKQPVPVPGVPGRTYQQFATVRPAFATDDLLEPLQRGGAVVLATPITTSAGC